MVCGWSCTHRRCGLWVELLAISKGGVCGWTSVYEIESIRHERCKPIPFAVVFFFLTSSIGMAKAALEVMNGLNLFGENGSSLSVIHVDPDAQYRNCVILNTLLPKESNSKDVDAALLLITGYPAFAIDDVILSKSTEQKVKRLLEVYGNWMVWSDCLYVGTEVCYDLPVCVY